MSSVKSMLSEDPAISSKRVITFLAFFLCGSAFIAMMFGYPIDQKLFDSMMYIVIAGLGFTASEKFAPTKEIK
jgi:cellulose synthase/poly-beta-1,6-N-acetylglucosamine synthase-like glycosyltransferase